MKYLFSAVILNALFSINVMAQDAQTIPPIDKSPMDMSTYPVNYPLLKIQDKATIPLVARVTYSRPQKNNRVIFGELLEYNTVWRFGANENTEIEFFKDVKINKVLVKKGKYSIFAIPNTDKWTIILNKDLNTWGSFKYDKAKDVLRVDIAVQKATEIAEAFYIYFDKTITGFSLNAGWDDVKITLPINM
jgi:Protein of unknown function (DUF2911)